MLETWYYYSHVLMASEKQRSFFSLAKVLIFFQSRNRNRNRSKARHEADKNAGAVFPLLERFSLFR